MALFPLPTPADVFDDSDLRVEQISVKYLIPDALVDIQQKIEAAADVAEMRLSDGARPLLWPFSDAVLTNVYRQFSPQQRADFTLNQTRNATLAVKYMALSKLFLKAGQLNPKYTEKADKYEADAENLLSRLEKSLMWISTEAGATDSEPTAVMAPASGSIPLSIRF